MNIGADIRASIARALGAAPASVDVFEHLALDLDGDHADESIYVVETRLDNADDAEGTDSASAGRATAFAVIHTGQGRTLRLRADPDAKLHLLGHVDLDNDGDEELWLRQRLLEYDEHLLIDVEGNALQVRGRANVP